MTGPLNDPRVVDGREFYFRYRYGMASLGLGANRFTGKLRYIEHGDDLQGAFEDEATRDSVLARLLDEPAEP